jgi:hypothetical protein
MEALLSFVLMYIPFAGCFLSFCSRLHHQSVGVANVVQTCSRSLVSHIPRGVNSSPHRGLRWYEAAVNSMYGLDRSSAARPRSYSSSSTVVDAFVSL